MGPLVAIVSVACLLTACSNGARGRAHAETRADAVRRRGGTVMVPEGSPLRARLRIEAIRARDVRRAVSAPARVEVDRAHIAHVTPPLAGRVVTLLVHFGDHVEADQPLLILDSPELVGVETALLEARARLSQADRDLARTRDLAQQGIASGADLERAETQRSVARSERAQWESRMRALGGRRVGRPLTLRAPIAGRVIDVAASPGEFRSDLSAPMMTIADLSHVWLTADLEERDIGRVRVGMQVDAELAAYPDEVWHGRVQLIGDLLDPERRTLPVRVAFDNAEGRLHPNMSGRVTFEETVQAEDVVPASAVLSVDDASYVFVEREPYVFEQRRVVPGDPSGDELPISGVSPGERVVVGGAGSLQ